MSDRTRRQFLKNSVFVVGAVGVGGRCRRLEVAENSVAKLRRGIRGRVIVAGDAEYEAARRVFYWNARTERSPRVVVRCAGEEDVRRAVDFARTQNLELAVRGGGHSHLGWGCSNGLVIDLSGMRAVSIDARRRVARVEGGALSGEVARAAGRYGLAPVLGQCPGVGASGVTLGGGLGWLSGLHGASCDNLISARVVIADGQIVATDSERNVDLFWALKGAGGNFGVTTAFEIGLHPVGVVTGGDLHYALRDARVVLRGFREVMDEAPDDFQATLNLTRGERGVFVSLCHAGSESEAEGMLLKLRAIAAPTKEFVRRQEFAELAERPAATNPANTPAPAFRGIQAVYRERLSDDVIDMVVERLEQAAPAVVMGISHYMHGQVCRVDPRATAFALREAGGLNVRFAYTWNDAATGETLTRWADESLRLLRPAANERIYANFQTYEAAAGAAAVYGVNYARLAQVKQKYDRENFFRRNSNVPASGSRSA